MNKQHKHHNATLKSIETRRSIRVFTDRKLDSGFIYTMLEAANHAPSAHNQQSWRFIIIEAETKSKLVDLVSAKSDNFPRPSSVLLRMAARSIASAPVVIAVINTGRLIQHGTELFKIEKEKAHDFFRVMEIQSSAAAVQNLLLAAASIGLATVWLGVLVLIKDDILRSLGEPGGEFMAVIPVGYPAQVTAGPRKKSLDAVIKRL